RAALAAVVGGAQHLVARGERTARQRATGIAVAHLEERIVEPVAQLLRARGGHEREARRGDRDACADPSRVLTTSPARTMTESFLPSAASSLMSFSGSPSTTSRSANEPSLTVPIFPFSIMSSALLPVAWRSSSSGVNTSLRNVNSRHSCTYVEPRRSVPKPTFTPARFIFSMPESACSNANFAFSWLSGGKPSLGPSS